MSPTYRDAARKRRDTCKQCVQNGIYYCVFTLSMLNKSIHAWYVLCSKPFWVKLLRHLQTAPHTWKRNILWAKVSTSELKFKYLGLLKLLVIVSLQFDQGAEDVLVLVGIFITQQHMLGLLINSWFLQIFQGGAGVVLLRKKKTI